eukprot:157683-Pyramimonas_sp.AAC.1
MERTIHSLNDVQTNTSGYDATCYRDTLDCRGKIIHSVAGIRIQYRCARRTSESTILNKSCHASVQLMGIIKLTIFRLQQAPLDNHHANEQGPLPIREMTAHGYD